MARKKKRRKEPGLFHGHLAPLSKKSFASLIFAATYGEPPKIEMRKKENVGRRIYLDRDD